MLNPLRYKVGGPSEVYAKQQAAVFAGWDRRDTRCRTFAACSMLKGCLLEACCLLGLLFVGTVDKVDGALCNLLITCRLSAINLVVSIKKCIFAADI